MDESRDSHQALIENLFHNIPKFLKASENLGRDGKITRSQLVNPSSDFIALANAHHQTFQKLVPRLVKAQKKFPNDEFFIRIMDAYDIEDPNKSVAKIGFLIKNSRIRETSAKVISIFAQDDTLGDGITEYLSAFLRWASVHRLLAILSRHALDDNFDFSDQNYEDVLNYLNHTEFRSQVELATIGAIQVLRLLSDDKEVTLDSLQADVTGIQNKGDERFPSSLDVYRERLGLLVWGPKQYTQSEAVIKKAHSALKDNKIVCFYGIGGVGKTALAQKLMYDIINKSEPYTHIVTYSSKVGSDQKEMNHIGEGLKRETDREVSVMDSSLVFHAGRRHFGGVYSFLKKIYSEVKGESEVPNLEPKVLEDVVLDILNDDAVKLFIVLDNFEDIEDNSTDSSVNSLRNEFSRFLRRYSEINTKSRIIITTRSSPMDVAYGIPINPLGREEAADLFARKLIFRAQRAAVPNPKLSEILQNAHRLVSRTSQDFHSFLEFFNVWKTNDDHIAHPLLVLLAAEDVRTEHIIDIEEIIRSWGEDSKGQDVLEYCVSKTLGSFSEEERTVIRALVQNGEVSADITSSYIESIVLRMLGEPDQPVWLSKHISKTLKSFPSERYLDIRFSLVDRSFLSESATTRKTTWNSIVWKHLRGRFVPVQNQLKNINFDDADQEIGDEVAKKLHFWNKGSMLDNSKLLSKIEIIDPFLNVSRAVFEDLEQRAVGNEPKFSLKSTISALDAHSVALIGFFEEAIPQRKKTDARLSTLFASSIDDVKKSELFSDLLNVFISHARAWRTLAELSDNENAKKYLEVSLICHDKLRPALRMLQEFLSTHRRFALLELIAIELRELAALDRMQETQRETLGLMQLSWLKHVGEHLEPWDCALKNENQLRLSETDVRICEVWLSLYHAITIEERGHYRAFVDGYAFWILLRMCATSREIGEQYDLLELDELKNEGYWVHKNPAIDQYIRNVQSTYKEKVSNFDDYISSLKSFRTQPVNGTLIVSPLKFDEGFGRWSHTVQDDWMLIIESKMFADRRQFEKTIVKQTRFNGEKKRIFGDFVLSDDGMPLNNLMGNMHAAKEYQEAIVSSLRSLIEEMKRQGLNSLSRQSIVQKLESNGSNSDESTVRMFAERAGLIEYSDYFIIDRSKSTAPPPEPWESERGASNITEAVDPLKIQLPRKAAVFSSMLRELYKIKSRQEMFKLSDYQNTLIKKKLCKRRGPDGAFYLFFALGKKDSRKYYSDWYNEDFLVEEIHSWPILKERLLESLDRRRNDINRRRPDAGIPKKVLEQYLEDVDDPSSNSG